MSDEKLRQLLSVLPEDGALAAGAARSRRKALARLDEELAVRPRVFSAWAPGLAVAAMVLLVVGAVQIFQAPEPGPPLLTPPERASDQRLQVHWVLSDGTRVHWTFTKDSNL